MSKKFFNSLFAVMFFLLFCQSSSAQEWTPLASSGGCSQSYHMISSEPGTKYVSFWLRNVCNNDVNYTDDKTGKSVIWRTSMARYYANCKSLRAWVESMSQFDAENRLVNTRQQTIGGMPADGPTQEASNLGTLDVTPGSYLHNILKASCPK